MLATMLFSAQLETSRPTDVPRRPVTPRAVSARTNPLLALGKVAFRRVQNQLDDDLDTFSLPSGTGLDRWVGSRRCWGDNRRQRKTIKRLTAALALQGLAYNMTRING